MEPVFLSQNGLSHSKKDSLTFTEKPEPIEKHNDCTNVQYVWSYDHSFNLLPEKTRQCVRCLNSHAHSSHILLKHCFVYTYICTKCKQAPRLNFLEIRFEFLKEIQSFGSSCRFKKKKMLVAELALWLQFQQPNGLLQINDYLPHPSNNYHFGRLCSELILRKETPFFFFTFVKLISKQYLKGVLKTSSYHTRVSVTFITCFFFFLVFYDTITHQ